SLAGLRERINAAAGAPKPAVDIALEDLGRIGDRGLQIPGPLKAKADVGRAGQSLLAVSCHDRSARPAARHGDALPSPAFLDKARAAAVVAARHRPFGAGDNVYGPSFGHREQTKPQPPAKLADTRVTFAPASPRCFHSQPDLVANIRPVYA